MSTETQIQFREGDVFRFRYSDERIAKARAVHHDLHWCFDGQVIVRDGKLCDTYWAGYRLSSGGDQKVVTPEDGTLEFICNLNDVERIKEYQTRYYDESEVFNLSYQHGCYRFFAVKKGQPRNQCAMLAWLDRQASEYRRDIERTTHYLRLNAEQRAKVEAGDVTVSIG